MLSVCLADLLKAEADGLTAVSSSEKLELQRLREESRELTLELRRKKDDLQATNQELLNAQGIFNFVPDIKVGSDRCQIISGGLEGLKAQRIHLEDIRLEIVNEIQRLRDTSKAELKRTDRMEQAIKYKCIHASKQCQRFAESSPLVRY